MSITNLVMPSMSNLRKKPSLVLHTFSVLFFLTLLSGAVFAITLPALAPITPGVPADNAIRYSVVILNPTSGSIINATTSITISHTASIAQQCVLISNGTGTTAPINVESSKTANIRLTFNNGTFWIVARCSNSSFFVDSTNITIIVNNATGAVVDIPPIPLEESPYINILSPIDLVKQTFNVTYKQTTGAVASCTVNVGSVIRANTSVATNILTTARYLNMDVGNYTINVTCSSASWTGFRLRNITVYNSTFGGLSVKPSTVYPGDFVKINGTLSGRSEVEISILTPSGAKNKTIVTTKDNGAFNYTYTVSMTARNGTYYVSAVDTLDGVTKNGTFVVEQRNPVLAVIGVPVVGKNVTVVGTNFLRNDNMSLILTGNGNVVTYVKTDTSGMFEYKFEGLLAKKYTLIAKSIAHPTTTVTISFNVSLPTIATKPSTPAEVVTDTSATAGSNNDNNNNNGGTTSSYSDDADQMQGVEQTVGALPEPSVEQPSSISDPASSQNNVASSSGINWMLFIVTGVIIVGVLIGYLAYNGTFSSKNNSSSSVGDLGVTHGGSGSNNSFTNVGLHDFIEEQRSRGFDDLTIRGALIAKGWDKSDVDKTFEEIYSQQ